MTKIWKRMTTKGQGKGASGHYFRFIRTTANPDVKIWIDKDEDRTYFVFESTNLGHYQFADKTLKTGFKNAPAARKWADENLSN